MGHYVPDLDRESKAAVKREPDNSYDKNAVAVINEKGECCGYLPRYDSRYFAPLLDRGAVAIEREPTGECHNARVSIVLHVKVLPEGRFIYDELKSDGVDAVYHQMMVEMWRRMDQMSDNDICCFRGCFRDLVHDDVASYETQFFYRMMKGVPEQRRIAQEKKNEEERIGKEKEEKEHLQKLRTELTETLDDIELHEVINCDRVQIIPLSRDGSKVKMVIDVDAVESGDLTFEYDEDRCCIKDVNDGPLPVLCRRGTLINDGFELFKIQEPCIIAADGSVLIVATTHFALLNVEDMPAVTLDRDESRGVSDCYKPEFCKERVRLVLSKCEEQFAMLDGCCGAALFVDGMFESLELYSCEEMLKNAFGCERTYVPESCGFMSNKQMVTLTERLIFRTHITKEETVTDGPVKKSLSLSLVGARGCALLGGRRFLYMGLGRENEYWVD